MKGSGSHMKVAVVILTQVFEVPDDFDAEALKVTAASHNDAEHPIWEALDLPAGAIGQPYVNLVVRPEGR